MRLVFVLSSPPQNLMKRRVTCGASPKRRVFWKWRVLLDELGGSFCRLFLSCPSQDHERALDLE